MLNELDALDKAQKAEGGGGAGDLVARWRFEAGYKVFITGLGNRESFFPFTPSDEAGQAAALAAAKKVLAEHKSEKKPNLSAQIVIYKASVKNKDVTWKDDRFFTFPTWTGGYQKAVKPALQKVGVEKTGEYWGRITFVPDPDGRKKKNAAGEEEVELLAVPDELYADEQAAEAAAGQLRAKDGGAAPADSLIPKGFTEASWRAQADDLRKLRLNYVQKGGMAGDDATDAAAKDYGATGFQLAALLSLPYRGMEIPF